LVAPNHIGTASIRAAPFNCSSVQKSATQVTELGGAQLVPFCAPDLAVHRGAVASGVGGARRRHPLPSQRDRAQLLLQTASITMASTALHSLSDPTKITASAKVAG
jgi:hypothetical protein